MSQRGFIDPKFEYSLPDYTVTAVISRGGGRFPFRDGGDGVIEEITYGDKGDSKTIQGSGQNPRAHTRVIKKPTLELTLPQDFATKFDKWRRNRLVDVILTRQKPGSIAVTDVVLGWLPIPDNASVKSGDGSLIKVSGNALRVDRDVRNVLA